MEALKQLLEVSAYEPGLGYSYDLKQVVEAGLERSEALRRWVALGRSEGSCYKAYKALKDDLFPLAFWKGKGFASDSRRLDVLEKHKVVGQLRVAGKKTAAAMKHKDIWDGAAQGWPRFFSPCPRIRP